ncbi:MAG: AMP-binding protein [Pseudanabaenaceae cyanobacterium bins.68]|nr:AMP-binding protein [Pseudanabaenaceae cyanobacterium bins.68]
MQKLAEGSENQVVVPDWLNYQARYSSDRLALGCGDRAWSFAQLELAVNQTSASFQQIHPNAKIALLSKNCGEMLLNLLAIARYGSTAILLNSRLSPIELTAQIAHSGASCLLYDPALSALVEQIDFANCQAFSHSPPQPRAAPEQLAQIDLNRVQGIMFSSGTTGQPKPIPLTFGQHYHSALALGMRLGFTSSDRILICLPLFHVGGLAQVWRSLIWGMGMVLLPSFQPQLVQAAIAQVTHISLVPTMLARILAHPGFDPLPWQRLRCILLGGAAPPPELVQTCLELKLPIALSYGMTEAASTVSLITPLELAQSPHLSNSVGQPLICNQVKIAEGEIWLQGSNLNGSGWYASGDLGYFDPQNYLHVLQRSTDLIISGGENIYPREIELILLTHAAIADACVVAQTDPVWGQSVGAVMVCAEALSLEQVQDYCLSQGLAKFKLPKVIKCLEQLPQTATGKIDRTAVQKILAQAQ